MEVAQVVVQLLEVREGLEGDRSPSASSPSAIRDTVAGHACSRASGPTAAQAMLFDLLGVAAQAAIHACSACCAHAACSRPTAWLFRLRPARSRRTKLGSSSRFRAAENKLAVLEAGRDADERTGPRRPRRRRRRRRLDGADRPLRNRARALDRPPGSGGLGRRRPSRGRRPSHRLPEEGPGEVGELRRAFNEMAHGSRSATPSSEQQSAELRESERMKTELVSIVSHELRTPLASVLGFTALLLKRDFRPAHAPPLPRHRRRPGAAPRRPARGLPRRPADRARGRRPRHGEDRPREPARRTGSAVRSAEPQAPAGRGARGAAARRSVATRGGSHRSSAPPLERDQVLARGRHSRARRGPEREGVRIAVRDEGAHPGGPAGPHLHEALPRRRERDRDHRHGLGLAGLREIVEAHGGRIGFDSDPGQGTTFWLELPGANGESRATQTKEAQARRAKSAWC